MAGGTPGQRGVMGRGQGQQGTQEEAAGPGPAAAGTTRGRQEPAWLQDEEDELWPEFAPCSPPGEVTSPTSLSPIPPVSPTSPASPTSPTAGTTEGPGGGER
ncbi:hypothetical protein AV530_001570 [Patagioenas fasciata monilis]|uniref:Uncharacterized protein n=1 Tax=Patagioenas fasciata monilis TaxID=372326 RepID=A0A1V4KY71_PATFA|nr:hypothetical protein AV530_001570 [Patagioenas fasciata monilis]